MAERGTYGAVVDDAPSYAYTHVTEAASPGWVHVQAREHVRFMVEQRLRDDGLAPLDAVVVTREEWTHEDGRALVTYRARAVGVTPQKAD